MSSLLAQSGHPDRVGECPLSGVRRTSADPRSVSAIGPARNTPRCPPLHAHIARTKRSELGDLTTFRAVPTALALGTQHDKIAVVRKPSSGKVVA